MTVSFRDISRNMCDFLVWRRLIRAMAKHQVEIHNPRSTWLPNTKSTQPHETPVHGRIDAQLIESYDFLWNPSKHFLGAIEKRDSIVPMTSLVQIVPATRRGNKVCWSWKEKHGVQYLNRLDCVNIYERYPPQACSSINFYAGML